MAEYDKGLPAFKEIECPECGGMYLVHLKIGEKELKDGYHGECPGAFCPYWHFESILQEGEEVKDTSFWAYQNTFLKFTLDMWEEQRRAQDKFPKPDRLLGALMEEVGELAQALLKIKESGASPEDVYKEAVQVAATVYRLATMGEPDYGYPGTKCHYGGCTQPVTGGPCALCYE